MVAKLDNNYVAKTCKKRGYKLVKYISIRKKVEVVCNTCKRPGSVWWSCIRDGHGCKWCAGNKIDLYQAFIDKQLKPNEPITTSRQKVKCICLGCKDEELYSTCEFYLKRRARLNNPIFNSTSKVI